MTSLINVALQFSQILIEDLLLWERNMARRYRDKICSTVRWVVEMLQVYMGFTFGWKNVRLGLLDFSSQLLDLLFKLSISKLLWIFGVHNLI